MMTRKHFEAIAEILDANVAPLATVSDFADYLERENERFDRQRFVTAATVKKRRHMDTDDYFLDVEEVLR